MTPSLVQAKTHYVANHPKEVFYPYPCEKCEEKFDFQEELLLHESNEHNVNHSLLKCKDCPSVYRLVWPHLWSTVVLSLEYSHIKSGCQQINFWLDLFWVAHDTIKIGHFFRK